MSRNRPWGSMSYFRVALADPFVRKAHDGDAAEMLIGGFATTGQKDHHQEQVLQEGLDWDYFAGDMEKGIKPQGFFRWAHTPPDGKHLDAPANYVGSPTSIQKGMTAPSGSKATRVEGVLFDHDKAKEIYLVAQAMQKANRAFGLSIEGNIQKRTGPDGKILAKAVVRNIAIDPHPVNDEARMQVLAKALEIASTDEEAANAFLAKACGTEAGKGGVDSGTIAPVTEESLEGKGEKKPKRKRRKPAETQEKVMDRDELKKAMNEFRQKNPDDWKQMMAEETPSEPDGLKKALDVATNHLDEVTALFGEDASRDKLVHEANGLRSDLESVAKAIGGLQDNSDTIGKAITAFGNVSMAIGDQVADLRKAQDAMVAKVESRMAVIEPFAKALGIPAEPAGQVAGGAPPVADHPAEYADQQSQLMTRRQALSVLRPAQKMAIGEGNLRKAQSIGPMVTELEAMPDVDMTSGQPWLIAKSQIDALVARKGA